ncbi:unnamed protein product [Schistosoma mattheei]|uniref:Uncharacterized protein n=1 Tax=Schistosoma mattheei TaxID=31246 RepID=A0A183NIG5_9TREM|nr:unnamed protein product [Schistosoma mattheei]
MEFLRWNTLQSCAWNIADRCITSEARIQKGLLLLPLLVVDRIMKTSTYEEKHGIRWTAWLHLDNLDFACILPVLSRTQQKMQKTTCVSLASASVGTRKTPTQLCKRPNL